MSCTIAGGWKREANNRSFAFIHQHGSDEYHLFPNNQMFLVVLLVLKFLWIVHRVVFNWVSKVISELLWFCITSLSDWFKVLAPLFPQIRSETKTNCGSRVHIFPRFVSATCNYFEFWLVYWICLRPFWLAKVITLVLVLRHSLKTTLCECSHIT